MKLNRRRFMMLMGGAGMSLAASPLHARSSEKEISADTFGCLVDITRCIGCRKCEVACNAHNQLPLQDFSDMNILDEQRRPDYASYTVVNRFHTSLLDEDNHQVHIYVKEQCRHCIKPACASACVVGALSKRADGPVVYNEKKCIGCRYCMIACPFQIPAYEDHDPVTPKVMKCTFCHDRIDKGQMPACATICPTQAIVFGKRASLLEIAHKRIQSNPGKYFNRVYGEKEVGGTSWMYLSPVDFDFFPKLGDTPPPKLTEMILTGVFGYAAAPTALFATLGVIAWLQNRKIEKSEGNKGECQ